VFSSGRQRRLIDFLEGVILTSRVVLKSPFDASRNSACNHDVPPHVRLPGATEMAIKRIKPAPPSDDKRWKMVDVTMRRNGSASHALIETLHSVQDAFGYLDDASMKFVAESLSLPLSKVYGVATFYHLFTLKPKGKHTCVICTGTACYIKGAGELVDGVRQRYDVQLGGTTEDSALSLLGARCVGACGLAPAVVLDGEVLGNVGTDDLMTKLEEVI
jgi:bidirectional [NiFe] hydrogenase diaphorase subunit